MSCLINTLMLNSPLGLLKIFKSLFQLQVFTVAALLQQKENENY